MLCHRATEMDITMIGLQNAGKTSLLRVLAVGLDALLSCWHLLMLKSRAESSRLSKIRHRLGDSWFTELPY